MSPQPQSRGPTPAVRERTGAAVHASRTARFFNNRHTRGVALALAAGVFLSFTGAFETGASPFPVRLLYWTSMMVAGSAAGVGISVWTERGGFLEARPWLEAGFIMLVLCPPLILFVWAVTTLIFCSGCTLTLARIPGFIAPVVGVTAAMTALNYIIQKKPAETHALPDQAPPRFLDRLPPKLRGAELYAVEAEDHYLRLHTSKGQDLILMRLSDAVAELEGIEGARTHRSWWVAKGAVTGARRGDGRATLSLRDGAEAPVSRAYAGALRAAGWY